MESRLKKLYKEAGLKGGNALILEKRENAVNSIMEDNYLDDENAIIIATWLMGTAIDDTEEILIDIEKYFCEQDPVFSTEDEIEMKVLCTLLLLEYCQESGNKTVPLIILCGKNIGKNIPCASLYEQFENMLDNFRVEIRECESEKGSYKETGMQTLRNSISEERDDQGEDEYEYSTKQIDKLISIVEIQDSNLKLLQKNNEILQKTIMCQREESDVLWWMINKWSHIYKKTFSNMTAEEMAIAVPLELKNYSCFPLFPYSVPRVIISTMESKEKSSETTTLLNYMENVSDEIMNTVSSTIDKNININVQPILGIIKCMKECGMEEAAWKGMMAKKYNMNLDDIKFTPIEFAKHFCMELELLNYL